MSTDVIQVSEVSRTFGARYILRNLSLAVAEGEAVAITGDNGAGKTTLLRIIATLLAPSSGSVTLFGGAPGDRLPEIRRKIGVLLADTYFYLDLSVHENLTLYARLHHLADAERSIAEWLERFRMSDHIDSPIRTLSRGERQRIGLIRSVLHRPRLILWDEPTTALDGHGHEIVNSVAAGLKGEATFLFATHEPEALSAWTDRSLHLTAGRFK
jgi:ABC-type multidrug transport system ATPase subunit